LRRLFLLNMAAATAVVVVTPAGLVAVTLAAATLSAEGIPALVSQRVRPGAVSFPIHPRGALLLVHPLLHAASTALAGCECELTA
jgi:hypothetical protein